MVGLFLVNGTMLMGTKKKSIQFQCIANDCVISSNRVVFNLDALNILRKKVKER